MRLVNEQESSKTAPEGVQEELFPRMNSEELRLMKSRTDVTVICRGFCVFTFAKDDRFSRNYCIVQLHLAGGINLKCLSELFDLSYQHCSRVLSRYKKDGVDGLREETSARFGNRRLIDDGVALLIEEERKRGRTFKEVAEIIRFKFKKRIREKSIRAWMSRIEGAELKAKSEVQLEMIAPSTPPKATPAASEWRRNIYAGSMILHGMLEWRGFLRPFTRHIVEDEVKRQSSSSVHRVMLTLFFLHALRCKSIEQGKHLVGTDFADLVGGDFLRLQPLRDAIDEIVEHPGFTLAIDGYYRDLIRMTDRGDRIYYTDGHFSSYYGKRKVPKGYDPRRQIGFKGRNTIYLHNSAGENVYLFESPTNTSLSNDIEKLVSDMKSLGMQLKRKTLFFDRGGYSTKCFRFLRANRMYFGTYLKNRKKEREIDHSQFVVCKIKTEEGEEIEYKVFEKEKRWTRFGQVRIIVFLGTDARQIPIITSNPFLKPATIVYLLSRRWREENSFKYMIEHFGIDLLCTYKTEQAPDKIIKRPNLERGEVRRLIQKKKGELLKLESDLAKKMAVMNRVRTIEEFYEEQKQLELAIKNVQVDIDVLERQKEQLPTKTEINLSDDHVIIAQKRRLFINAIKAMNYNAEKWLQIMFKEHHAKADETLSLIRSIFKQPGRIRVADGLIDIVLDPLDIRSMRESLTKVLEKLRENNHLRMPDGQLLRII